MERSTDGRSRGFRRAGDLLQGDGMRTVRVLVASVLVVGLSTSALAGDLMSSVAKAADQQEPAQKPRIEKTYAVLGGALFAGGMALATYGFLHTKGGEFVSGEVSKESKTQIGGAGLAIAGAGGAILYLGAQKSKRSASVTVGNGRVALSKRVSW
jgi:hypothetical protein